MRHLPRLLGDIHQLAKAQLARTAGEIEEISRRSERNRRTMNRRQRIVAARRQEQHRRLMVREIVAAEQTATERFEYYLRKLAAKIGHGVLHGLLDREPGER